MSGHLGRHWPKGLALAGFVVVVMLLIASALSPGPIRVDNHTRITYGMTKPEVERILGGPPGNYLSHLDLGFVAYGRQPMKYTWTGLVEGGTLDLWYTDRGMVFVNYREDGTVFQCSVVMPGHTQSKFYFPR